MGSLTPEHYKISKVKVEKYVDEVETYVRKVHPIFLVEDVRKQIAEGNKIIGRIEVMIDALKDNSEKLNDWKKRKNEVETAVNNIYEHHPLLMY